MGLGKKELGGLVALRFLLTLKRELEVSISNQMSPLQRLYEHLFHMKRIFPHSITNNAYCRDLGSCVDTKVFLI